MSEAEEEGAQSIQHRREGKTRDSRDKLEI